MFGGGHTAASGVLPQSRSSSSPHSSELSQHPVRAEISRKHLHFHYYGNGCYSQISTPDTHTHTHTHAHTQTHTHRQAHANTHTDKHTQTHTHRHTHTGSGWQQKFYQTCFLSVLSERGSEAGASEQKRVVTSCSDGFSHRIQP